MRSVILLMSGLVMLSACFAEDTATLEEALGSCGNGKCNGQETCASCPQDCGSCTPFDAGGGGTADAGNADAGNADAGNADAGNADAGTEVADAGTYPPPSTETALGNFLVKCTFSHQAQVDPIVNPGPAGTPSAHTHDFFGNTTTDSDSTYSSMLGQPQTCALAGDTAAYWQPALVSPTGEIVQPSHMFSYYRNRPVDYGSTVAFPPDFRMIAMHDMSTFDQRKWWWNCHDAHTDSTRFTSPPQCPGDQINLTIMFPNCWDGVNIDSPDHRSHVVWPVGGACPPSHPVKLPDLRYAIEWDGDLVEGGPGWTLSSGGTIPHADFWNTWDQAELEHWLDECTRAGITCGRVSD